MDKWHVILIAIGAGFTVATVALLLHFKADLATSLIAVGAFVTTIGMMFTRQLGKKEDGATMRASDTSDTLKQELAQRLKDGGS